MVAVFVLALYRVVLARVVFPLEISLLLGNVNDLAIRVHKSKLVLRLFFVTIIVVLEVVLL